jgi:hypothetical protein
MPGDHRLFYNHADQGHPSNPAAQLDPAVPGSGMFRMGNASMQMPPPNPYMTGMPYGNPSSTLYPQQPPSLLGPPHFQNPTSNGNNMPQHTPGAEGQMQ